MKGFAVLVLLMCVCAAPARAAGDALALERLHEQVPPFALSPTIDAASLRGRAVLLHFWASWCEPCKRELPELDRLAATLTTRGLEVMLVTIDERLSRAELEAFTRDLGVTLPIHLAREGEVPAAFWGWGLPVSYLIDADGRFVGRLRGPRAWSQPKVVEAVAKYSGLSAQ
jgi:thiol-disulfide isomerase/thioredoxin